MSKLIPVTIVTGFLGSGKTTLLRSVIERRQTRRLAVLINEFGEISIDSALVRDGAGDDDQVRIHEFSQGLIAYGDDALFVPTMLAIAARRAHVDHVLIETSGLALPTAVMELLQSAELAADFILDATLAVVDTPLLLSNQFEHGVQVNPAAEMFERQLEFADVVVLNKVDELDEEQLLLAESRVRQRAPNVRFLELAHKAQLDIRLALGLRLHQPTRTEHEHAYAALPTMPGPQASVLAVQGRLDGHAHSGMAAHSHGLATHKHFHEQDPGWLSFVLRSKAPQRIGALKEALLQAARREPILRSKGFIQSDEAPGAVLVQGVRARIAMSADSGRADVTRSELVFIGYHLSRSNVAQLLSSVTGTRWY
jgi:cobalamin biosynthesis protein CobW